ncbi:MAG: nucleotide exchange factor GrpE [Candidatus Thermoplasmatota archaeon]|nr:nucleotide exchange factor GrpE [Candidatus Thermoplasmatota archaeon]
MDSRLDNLKSPINSEIREAKERIAHNLPLALSTMEELVQKLTLEKEYEKDRLMRRVAEADNLMKAKDREVSVAVRMSNRDLLLAILPFLDSVDSAISAHPDNDGIMTLKDQILKILKGYGLETIDAKGKKYDPYQHEAVAVIEDGEDGLVVDELQKGYKLNDEVIRTSKVAVSKGEK